MAGYKEIRPDQGFKPGYSGNPRGRPKILEENHGVKKLTADDLRRMITRHFNMTFPELSAIAENPESTALELSIASCLNKAIQTGDFAKVTLLIERVIGRVPDLKRIEDPKDEYYDELSKVPPGELVAYLRSQRKAIDVEVPES